MIPLKFAVLCVECDTVSRGRNNQCELCGSRALMNLSAVLDRNSIPVSKPQEVAVRMGAA
jgi:RNA polymerase subunit RPABC4/transcription elongation factor Spt4